VPETQYQVLVLEDDPDAAEFLRIALDRYGGMHVDVVGSADQAVEAVRRKRYDVLVSDIQLPGRSGLDVLPEIRAIAPAMRLSRRFTSVGRPRSRSP